MEAGIEADAKFPSVLSIQKPYLISQTSSSTGEESSREILQEFCPEHPNAMLLKAAGMLMLGYAQLYQVTQSS